MFTCLIDNLIYKKDQSYKDEKIDFLSYGDIFGVFVGIERSNEQKLSYFPYDIHGCMGYWDPQYKVLSNNNILDTMNEVGINAMYYDNRRKSFSKSPLTDLQTKIKIYLMLLPTERINRKTGRTIKSGIVFDNKMKGLIVENKDGRNSTFLPDVYPNKSWRYIRDELISKSRTNVFNPMFLSYSCKILSTTLYDYILAGVISFCNRYITSKDIPYYVNNNGIIMYDKNEWVRNIASMYDFFMINDISKTNSLSQNTIKYIKDITYNIVLKTKIPRQSLSFLLLLLNRISPEDNKQEISNISDMLYNDIEHKILEPKFEYGEALVALSIVNPRERDLQREEASLIKTFKRAISQNKKVKVDSIFTLNWLCQFVRFYNSENTELFSLLKTMTLKTLPLILRKRRETNYIAVSYECIANLSLYGSQHKLDISECLSFREYLTELLIKRRNQTFGLLMFLDGTMRVDITTHFTNGMIAIQLMYNEEKSEED